jgi:hypothetical protein
MVIVHEDILVSLHASREYFTPNPLIIFQKKNPRNKRCGEEYRELTCNVTIETRSDVQDVPCGKANILAGIGYSDASVI